MKKNTAWKNVIFMSILLIAFIANSCRKDNYQSQKLSPAIEQAKSWYESIYTENAQSVKQIDLTSLTGTVTTDFSKVIKPDWSNSNLYSRFGNNVIETPIDPDSKFSMNLKNDINKLPLYNKSYSKSSFLFLNQNGLYKAYIMTIIADSAYMKNDMSKLDRNRYNKRDTDFSGVVLYSTPKGEFVNGWFYKNGIILSHLSPDNQLTASTVDAIKQVNSVKSNYITNTCVDWYQTTTVNGVTSAPIYLGRICKVTYTPDGGDGGSGTIPGTGTSAPGGDSGGTGIPAPTPCIVPHTNSIRVTTNTVTGPPGNGDNPDDGGFPPPTTTAIPCPPTAGQVNFPAQDIVTDGLSLYPCAKARIIYVLLSIQGYASFVEPFCSSTQKPSITWQTGTLAWNSPAFGMNNAYELGHTVMDPTSVTGQSSIITLNNKMLGNSSELIIAAAAIHETLHAYINYNISTAEDAVRNNYRDPGNWFSALDAFYSVRSLPANYRDHYQMLTDYFNQAIAILATWDNNRHTAKEYTMAMLFGLNTNDATDPAMIARLNQVYNALLTAGGITQQDLDAFYQANIISAPSAQKLPTSGCN